MRIAYNESNPLLRRIPVYLYDSSRQPVTGAAPAGAEFQLSLDGAAWANFTGVWAENAGGLYYAQLTQAETVAFSFVWLKIIIAGVQTVQFPVSIGDRVVQSEATPAARRFPIYLTDSANAPVASLNLAGASQVQIGKNGAAMANIAGTVAEIGGAGNGQGGYYYEATAAEINTLGYDVLKVFPTGLSQTRYIYTWNVIQTTISSAAITIAVVSPAEGSVIGRATPLQFTVTGAAPFRRVWVSAQLGGSAVEETVHDGIAFAPAYSGGSNSRSNVIVGSNAGYQFNVLRVGAWRGSSVTLKITAVDVAGNVGYKTVGVPLALYTWQIAGGGDGDVTPSVGQGGA